jgi:hypothetical protein
VAFYYSVLRFVPDPARGEFINLGVIVGAPDSQDWALRLISNHKRASAIDGAGTLPAALAVIGRLEERLPGEDEDASDDALSLELLQRLSTEMNNIVQISPPAPVVAETAEGALDLIFEEVVVDPAAVRFRFERKHRAAAAVRGAYRSHDIPRDAIAERVRLVVGSFHAGFDFAVHNGHAVQLVQCWSFQLPNQETLGEQVKAWAWVVRELREQGGCVLADTHRIDAPDGLEVAAVFVPPLEGKPRDTFNEACAAFNELNVEARTPDGADIFAVRAAEALSAG